MKDRRIVVTGMGVVSCLGDDVDTYYNNLLAGKSGVSRIESFPVDEYSTRFAAWIQDFSVGDFMEKKQARRMDPYIGYTMVAGKKALAQAGLLGDALEKVDRHRCGVLVGSGMGGMGSFFESTVLFHEKGPRKMSPFFVPRIITNMGGAMLAMDLDFMGPNYSISTACATAANCMVSAAHHIERGDADVMVCGGVEAAINPVGLVGFIACKALSQRNDEPTRASRPWDKGRDGFVIGEGAGVIILEEYEHAKRRGAHIIAEYYGGGLSCDAYHMTEPRPDGKGIGRCIQNALDDARINKESVDHINAHATSTPAGDMAEISAIKQVFTEPGNIAINSTKSMLGHCLGAAAGVETVALLKAIETGSIHPTINLENPEDGIKDFIVPTEAIERKVDTAMTLSFGFGGHNAALIFGKLR